MTERAPDWLRNEVVSGLQRLLLLNLESGPALDSIEGVAMAWVDACQVWPIAWEREADAPRLRLAFRTLAANSRRWPAPVQLREALPLRTPPPRLPPPDVDPARVAQAQQEIAEILAEPGGGGVPLGGLRACIEGRGCFSTSSDVEKQPRSGGWAPCVGETAPEDRPV